MQQDRTSRVRMEDPAKDPAAGASRTNSGEPTRNLDESRQMRAYLPCR
jgi:hypothetical protein